MKTLPKRFTDKIDFSGECWLWKAGKFKDGYGQYRSGEKMVKAHRFCWEYLNGEIQNGLLVLHKCDIRHCVNPEHHFLGTQKDNMADMRSKVREHNQKGEKNGNVKLNQSQVDEIRALYKPVKGPIKSEFSASGLGRKYGVSSKQIGNIVSQKSWKREEDHEPKVRRI